MQDMYIQEFYLYVTYLINKRNYEKVEHNKAMKNGKSS